jgi:hypothetical protein
MKKQVLLVFGLALMATAVFARGKSEPAAPPETDSRQKLSFEFRYNLAVDDPENNYFAWTLERQGPNGSTEKRIVRDALDPARTTVPASHVDTQTGASAFGTTVEFANAMNVNRMSVFPSALRGLMLYAVAPRSYAINEDLRVEQQGKKLTFFWTHNANSNMLWTNDNGEIEFDNCMATLATCDRPTPETIQVKPEYLRAGADDSQKSSIDWEKVVPAMNRSAPNSTEFQYTGRVAAAYDNGIITITGDLILQPK